MRGPRLFAGPSRSFLPQTRTSRPAFRRRPAGLSRRNLTGDVEEVPAADVRYRKLLNQSGNARRLTAVHHHSSTNGGTNSVGDSFSGPPPKASTLFVAGVISCRRRLIAYRRRRPNAKPISLEEKMRWRRHAPFSPLQFCPLSLAVKATLRASLRP